MAAENDLSAVIFSWVRIGMDGNQIKNRKASFVLGIFIFAALACKAPTAPQIAPTVMQPAQQTLVAPPTAAPTNTMPLPGTTAPQPTAPQTGDPAFIGPVYFSDQPSTISQNT